MEYKHILTEEEGARLAALAAGDPQRRAMLRLVWNAGLTVAETASLRWEDVDLAVPCLRAGGRTVPLVPEAAAALKRLGRGRSPEWVFPSRRNPAEPVARMTVNRELRRLLDEAGLSKLVPKDLRNQYLLRALEETTLEEAVRLTGIQPETLRDTWREYGRTEPIRPTPAGSVRPDDPALAAALEKEGDTLDGRIVRLSWQGGLLLREIQALRWADVSHGLESWNVDGEERPVPSALRPWLEAWSALGGEYVAAGPRSGRPLEMGAMSRRMTLFFARHGLEGLSASGFRGNGQVEEADKEALLALVRRKGYYSLDTARQRLGMTANQIHATAAALRREGRLDPAGGETLRLPGERTPRERLYGALEESRGGEVTTRDLQRRSGLTGNLFYYYMREAAASGRLRRTGKGRYRVP